MRLDEADDDEDPDIAKIKKVQSFFRGWLCRRRWKQIVDEYIRSFVVVKQLLALTQFDED